MSVILQTYNLSKIYGRGESAVRALKNVNIKINSGEMTAIIGASGSGKSTLLKIIGGLDRNADGKAVIDDRNLMEMNDKQLAAVRASKIGFVFQFFKLIPELTAKENILLPAMICKSRKAAKLLDELAVRLQIQDRLSHFPAQLSGGQQQRVAIARALINNPDILLCDEPTGNLDKKTSGEVIRLLKDFNVSMGKTIVIVTHDLSIAKECRNVIRISDGEIVKVAENLKNL